MPFEPITWLLGYTLTRATNLNFEKHFSIELPKKLADVARLWAGELPPDASLWSEALLPDATAENLPYRDHLQAVIDKPQVPTQSEWFDALYEQWDVLHQRSDTQDFFQLDAAAARGHLERLTERLERVCKAEAVLVFGTLVDNSRRADAVLQKLGERLDLTAPPLELAQTPPERQGNPLSIVAEQVLASATVARPMLMPSILRRISRECVTSSYLPSIRTSLGSDCASVIPIVGPAGYGKSAIMSQLYDDLVSTDDQIGDCNWVGVILGSEVGIDATQSSLSDALGRAVANAPAQIETVVETLTSECGRGVLLIDTVDLFLNAAIVPALRRILINLVRTGTTVAFTCRDFEFSYFLEPLDIRMAGLDIKADNARVPEFTSNEVIAAAQTYLRDHGNHSFDQTTQFTTGLLELSADRRPIAAIVHNPLLLGLLCKLFGSSGVVPPDLTVSKLYELYWASTIERSRKKGVAVALQKSDICLDIAGALYSRSESAIHQWLNRDEVTLSSRAEAFAELVSDDVLKYTVRPERQLGFFHQTFLEYAIARWLTSHSGGTQIKSLLARVAGRETQSRDRAVCWWPVVRQVLSICTHDAFELTVEMLDLQQWTAFRAVSLAAAARYDATDLQQRLVPIALKAGIEHQQALYESVEPNLSSDEAWLIGMRLLRDGEQSVAIRIARSITNAIGCLDTLEVRTEEALTAIMQRSENQRAEVAGWFVGACSSIIEIHQSEAGVRTLIGAYIWLGISSKALLISLVLRGWVSSSTRSMLLATAMGSPTPQEINKDVEGLLVNVWHELDEDQLTVDYLLSFLHQHLPKGWHVIRARVIGHRASTMPDVLAILTDMLLNAPTSDVHAISLTLCCAITSDSVKPILNALVATGPPRDLKNRCYALYNVTTLMAAHLTIQEREKIVTWLAPVIEDDAHKWFGLVCQLASGSAKIQNVAEQLIRSVPSGKRSAIVSKSLRYLPQELRATFSRLLQYILAAEPFDARQQLIQLNQLTDILSSDAGAIDQIRNMALTGEPEIARRATRILHSSITGETTLTHQNLLPLTMSPVVGVRNSALDCILALQRASGPLSNGDFTILCDSLKAETDPQVAQRFCRIVIRSVVATHRVDPVIIPYIAGLLNRVIGARTLEGGSARLFLSAFDQISERATVDQLAELEMPLRKLLVAIDLRSVRGWRQEPTDILLRIEAVASGVLHRIVSEECQVMSYRNVQTVIEAIRIRTGVQAALLTTILSSDWVHPENRNMILRWRGA